MLLSGMFVAGVTSLVIPELTRLSGGLLIACRAILGATNVRNGRPGAGGGPVVEVDAISQRAEMVKGSYW